MIKVRRSQERGHAEHGWLKSAHTFSFGGYYDASQMGFRGLRVINDDRVAPGGGFAPHDHQDMEIISYVVEGALEHRDSLGNGAVLRFGDVQRMSAGRGVRHSEFNASKAEPVRFLQIWIPPRARGLEAGYEDRHFAPSERRNTIKALVAPGGAGGALDIQQDAALYGTLLDPGAEVAWPLRAGRHAWVQVVRGEIELNGVRLSEGDGAAVSEEAMLRLRGVTDADALWFDLA
jgi:redox-sensitive bicupin YhaK (pirin superfamily)